MGHRMDHACNFEIGKKKNSGKRRFRERELEKNCCFCLQGTRESGEHVVIVFRCKAVLERAFVS